MGGSCKAEGGGYHFTFNAQCLQGSYQGEGAIGKNREIFNPQVLCKFLFKLLMKRAFIREDPVGPDFFQVNGEFL